VSRSLPGYAGWIGVDGAHPRTSTGGTAEVRYVITPTLQTRFRPREPGDAGPIPVISSPNLAAAAGPGGVVPVQIVDQQFLVKVVGVARRFPTLTGSYVVADESSLFGVLNGEVPGSGQVEEVWVDGRTDAGPVDRALTRPPFDVLALQTYSGAVAALSADPLGHGTLVTLGVAAIVALALALCGLLLAVVSDLRDERGELHELEAQGVSPADLRRLLRLRALVVATVGVVGGLATGAVLSLLVVGVVRLTAGAETPVPPLRLDVDWSVLALALVAYAAAAVLLVGAVTWAAFRSPVASTAEAAT
jgi:ABC-type antimicrobial peptide transport system permease subunit